MKKFLTLFLVFVLTLGMMIATGCQREPDDQSSAEPLPEGIVFNEKSGELYYNTKENKTPIKVTYSDGNGHEWIRQSAGAFLQAEEGKDYYFVLTSDNNATAGMSSKLEGGTNLDDIYCLLASPWYSYAALDQLENLDDLYDMTIPGETKTVGNKITGTWTTYGKAKNRGEEHYYVFPLSTMVTGIVYNKTMFDEYGWQVPATVDELATLCEKIVADTKGAIKPFVYPGAVDGGYWDFVGTNWWLQVTGKEKMDEFMKFETAENFNHDKMSSPSYGKYLMLETYESLIVKNRNKYVVAQSASYLHKQAQQQFGAGVAAMIPNGSWIQNESGKDIDDEIRMMPVPLMDGALSDGGKPITYNYSGQPDFICIPKAASNKEGAKAFLAYMCRDDMLKKYTEVSGTARPFDYDVTGCNVNEFQRSCLDIWANSITWFEASTSDLWTGSKIRKFNSGSPYTAIMVNYPSMTADQWCASEYTGVRGLYDSLGLL